MAMPGQVSAWAKAVRGFSARAKLPLPPLLAPSAVATAEDWGLLLEQVDHWVPAPGFFRVFSRVFGANWDSLLMVFLVVCHCVCVWCFVSPPIKQGEIRADDCGTLHMAEEALIMRGNWCIRMDRRVRPWGSRSRRRSA